MRRTIVRSRRALAVMAIALLGAIHSACAQDLVIDGETIADARLLAAARKDGRVVYYGIYPENGMDLIRAAFAKDTGVAIEFVRLITQRMHPRVVTEFAARKLEADYVDLTDLTLVTQRAGVGQGRDPGQHLADPPDRADRPGDRQGEGLDRPDRPARDPEPAEPRRGGERHRLRPRA